MTLTPEILLSDQFAEFSGKVTALHEKKKELTAELKKVVEDFRGKIKAIDDEATDLQSNFNNWAASSKVQPTQPKPAKPTKETA